MHLAFAVAATALGPGEYYDDDGNKYYADAGNIGLVPLELVEKRNRLGFGLVITTPGVATFHSWEGIFTIKLPEDILVRIDTTW